MTRIQRTGAWAVVLLLLPLLANAGDPYKKYDVVKVKDGPNVLVDLKTAFQNATPGTIIQLPEAVIDVDEELSLTSDFVVVRGKGMKKTVLNFAGQVSGGQGILASGDHIAFEDFAVEDPPGDGIRAENMRGLIFRRVRVEWTGPLSSENGAYGVYPVLCEDVLIEEMKVIGASDAGIYVGQSQNIIVRHNTVKGNVAGIEIENSVGADVYKNKTKDNTGGILVFNLPGLSMLGSQTRVYKNLIKKNNGENVGAGTVGQVPPGTGVIILANDDVEVFKNVIKGNQTVGVAIASYGLVDDFDDEEYDPFSETIYVHNNDYKNNGYDAQGELGLAASIPFGGQGPDVFLARDIDPAKLVDDALPPELETCVQEEDYRFHDLNLAELLNDDMAVVVPDPVTDIGVHDCAQPRHDKIVIPDTPKPPDEEIAAACVGGPNAFQADCPKLSDYGLFVGNDPRVPTAAGVSYDLTSPLFSDYATKYRAAFVPDGQTLAYNDTDPLDFPVGTILTKTFAFAEDLRNPEMGEALVETRLLIHRDSGWVGLPFIWNFTEGEAYLSVIGGGEDVSFTFFDGSQVETNYRIPNKNQCGRCHFDGPIGPKVRLLNRDYDYDGGTENQITHWADIGLLTGAPDPALAPRLPFPEDEGDGTLEERAKAYLESNCAHCHNPDGNALSTGLFLEHDRPVGSEYGICRLPGAAGLNGTGGRPYDIVPGSADDSILTYRMGSVDPNITMPELAKSLVHEFGVALVADWIDTLPGDCE